MDPATLLMLVGAFYAVRTGLRAVRSGSHASSAAALPRSTRGGKSKSKTSSTSSGGGMPRWLTPQRHTGSGWWSGEILHGFPVFRAGVSEGWSHHQTAMHQRQAQTAKAKADGTAQQITYRQERQQHLQRIEAARAAAAASQPPAKPASSTPASQPSGVMAPPPAGSNGSSGRGGQPATRPASAPPAANGQGNTKPPDGGNPTGGSMPDTTYESTEATLDEIRGQLDHAVNDATVTQIEGLADALPAMLPDDSETVGHVADVAAALKEAQAAQQRAIDACEAAKTSHAAHNQASKEAADAQGGAPEREYVTGG